MSIKVGRSGPAVSSRALAISLVALSLTMAGPASAHESPPPKNDDSTGCCFSFRDSPVILCMTADACRFAAPPTGPK